MSGGAVFVRLLRLVRPWWKHLVLSVLAGAIAIGSGVALMGTSAYLIAAAALRPPITTLMLVIVAVRLFSLTRSGFRYLERLISHDLSFRLLADLRVWLYCQIEPRAPAGLQEYRSGDLLNRILADVDTLQNVFSRVLGPPLVALGVAVGACLALWLFLPSAALALAVTLLGAGIGVPWLAFKLGQVTGRQQISARAALAGEVVELFQAAPEIVAYGQEQLRLNRLVALDTKLTRLAATNALANGLTEGLGVLLTGAGVWLVLLLAIPAVRLGTLPGVFLGALALIALASFEGIRPLPVAFQQLAPSLQAAQRIFALAEAPLPVRDPIAPRPILRSGAVTLSKARLRYGPDEPWALDGIDLELNPGQRVALVGPSGAGKTSLAQVLVRFRDLDGGCACLAGHDLREYAADDLRQVIGLATQDAHLFNTSIRENVRLARPTASDVEIVAALRRARVWDWVQSLPRGWDTPVGESGVQVSGGQRQRLALARALLADFPVVIFDEPTANLDPATADALMADLLAAVEGRATLLITHRLAGLESVDEIVVLDHGRVIERGSFGALLARRGAFARMWALEGG